jgi:hypothetical protein
VCAGTGIWRSGCPPYGVVRQLGCRALPDYLAAIVDGKGVRAAPPNQGPEWMHLAVRLEALYGSKPSQDRHNQGLEGLIKPS